MWIGSAHITMSKTTSDISIGYTMQSDFWFRVGPDGSVKGNAYAAYQPTFDPAGLNGKIAIAKSIFNGVISVLPSGEIAASSKAAKLAVDAGKAGGNLEIAGLIGVVGKYNDPKPIRAGALTGSLRDGKLTLAWSDAQPTEIPVTVSLQYINMLAPLMQKTLQTQIPWHKVATVDPDSGGRFAIAQEQARSSKGGVTESLFAYWSATRVE